jgi:rhodanese-related sulfurtransferase
VEDQHKNKNFLAVAVGFVLIILIGAFTFFKSAKNQESANLDQKASPVQTEKKEKDARALSDSDLLKKIQARENLTLIDLRDADSFRQEHLVDSKNIPLDQLEKSAGSLDKEKKYVLIDEVGGQNVSFLANDLLPKNGFAGAFYLEGGFAGWKNKNNPTISDGDPNSFVDQSKINYLNSDQLKKILTEEKNLYLIDLRSEAQFKEGHLSGAQNIFLDDLEKRRGELPLGKKFILYDNDGLWAFKGAVRLFDLNFFNTFTLADGLDGWKKKGFEVVK